MAATDATSTPAAHGLPRWLIPVVLVLLIAGGVVAMRMYRAAQLNGPVRASGMIEMDEIDVGSLVGGRIERLLVDEGDRVKAGDTLAVLTRGELISDAMVQSAQANRASAQSSEIANGPRAPEVRLARANLAAAEAQVKLAASELVRGRALFADQVIAQADLDRLVSTHEAAVASRDAMAERLRLLELGNRKEQVTAARDAATAARASLQGARSRLDELVLTAPRDGVVLLRNFVAGELVNPGQPVVTLGDPERLWIRVYVAAPRITDVVRGAHADILLSKDNKERFPGRIVEIASQAEFTPRVALTEEERANLVFGVKIALEPTGGRLKAGLPADAIIPKPAHTP